MKIIPTSVQQQINRVDRQRSLMIGIGCGVFAFWCLYRVIWSIYLATTYNFFFGSLVFEVVLWGLIGAVAAIATTGFLTRYMTAPTAENSENNEA